MNDEYTAILWTVQRRRLHSGGYVYDVVTKDKFPVLTPKTGKVMKNSKPRSERVGVCSLDRTMAEHICFVHNVYLTGDANASLKDAAADFVELLKERIDLIAPGGQK